MGQVAAKVNVVPCGCNVISLLGFWIKSDLPFHIIIIGTIDFYCNLLNIFQISLYALLFETFPFVMYVFLLNLHDVYSLVVFAVCGGLPEAAGEEMSVPVWPSLYRDAYQGRCAIFTIIETTFYRGLSQDFKSTCPKQQFQNFCPSSFIYLKGKCNIMMI